MFHEKEGKGVKIPKNVASFMNGPEVTNEVTTSLIGGRSEKIANNIMFYFFRIIRVFLIKET